MRIFEARRDENWEWRRPHNEEFYVVLIDSLHLFNLLEFLAEAFRSHVHNFQCLTVPVELAAMFRFVVVGIAEMLLWLVCLIVSKSVGFVMYLII